jgi:hypothetical protein
MLGGKSDVVISHSVELSGYFPLLMLHKMRDSNEGYDSSIKYSDVH